MKTMARILYPDPTRLPPELKELLRQANLNVFTMWAHSVNTATLIIELGAAQFAKLELPRAIREIVTLSGAIANSADYEWGQHVALSAAAGVSDEQRTALQRGEVDAPCFKPAERAALRLAAAVQKGPKVADVVFDEARRYLSDRQMVELVGLVGYYWMLGRIATVFQVELDVPQGTEVLDAGLALAARTQRQ
jgi:alkylhydroperoxidase family enzyme